MNKPVIVIAGGSGFLGQLLAQWFTQDGYKVVILSRKPFKLPNVEVVRWDGARLDRWSEMLDGAYALINLAGRSVDCRYTQHNKKQMWDSRIMPTRVLGQAIASCSRPPKLWLNASTATIYEHSFGCAHDESGVIASSVEAKDEYSVELATAWEEEFRSAICTDTRKVLLRIAMVFDRHASVYPVLARLVRLGLGGAMAGGQQYVSWIHSRDFCRAIQWIVQNDEADGAYNIAAPKPLRNGIMMKELREKQGVSFGLPATRWMLEIGAFFLRTETELIIKSRNVIPARLLEEGFKFEFSEFKEMLDSIDTYGVVEDAS